MVAVLEEGEGGKGANVAGATARATLATRARGQAMDGLAPGDENCSHNHCARYCCADEFFFYGGSRESGGDG